MFLFGMDHKSKRVYETIKMEVRLTTRFCMKRIWGREGDGADVVPNFI